MIDRDLDDRIKEIDVGKVSEKYREKLRRKKDAE